MRVICPHCNKTHYDSHLNSAAGDALRELVELKQMKDAGNVLQDEYDRRELIAWQRAFVACNVVGEPKP